MELEAIIGLEVHVQLKTKSKMFCRCDNRDDQPPNTAICPICTAQPGALPLPNQQAIDWAIMAALALGCSINQESKFDRKNYFYPDLPKGYQISQYDKPFGYGGSAEIPMDGTTKKFRVHRLHLEEDAGKLLHEGDATLVDLNRSGTPLLEIVSEPDFRTPAEAKSYLQELRLIMRYLGISDADMEKGHLRCDANISLRPAGDKQLYPKTEIKNVNSFRSVERALEFEIKRQSGLWGDDQVPTASSTRGWDETSGKTLEQRTKEEAADYRYFPEPDIPPIVISDQRLQELQDLMPELPAQRRERFSRLYALSPEISSALVAQRRLTTFFEEVVSEFRAYAEAELAISSAQAQAHWEREKGKDTRLIANWLTNKFQADWLGHVRAQDVGRLLWMLHQNLVNSQAALRIAGTMAETKRGPHELMKELGLEQVSDTGELERIVSDVIAANPKVVTDLKNGKAAATQFFVGQVMKATQGKANPQVAQQVLKQQLGL